MTVANRSKDRRLRRGVFAVGLVLSLGPSCRFDPAYRDFPEPKLDRCTEGRVECRGASLTRCDEDQVVVVDDCGARGMACAPTLLRCTPCLPGELTCEDGAVLACDAEGQKRDERETCIAERGFACRRGECVQLCERAARDKSNVGCEYWP